MSKWIDVNDRLPEVEERVLICVEYPGYLGDKIYHDVTCGFYEDGKMWREDSKVCWGSEYCSEYDEEKDDYLVPEGWVEECVEMHGEDEWNCVPIISKVVAWMPLPKYGDEEV